MKTKINFIAILILFSAFIGSSNQYTVSENTAGSDSYSQKPVRNISKMINEKKLNNRFQTVDVFSFERNTGENDNTASVIRSASLMKLNKAQLKNLIRNPDDNIVFRIPVSGNNYMELELTKSFPVSNDFKLFSIDNSGKRSVPFSYGLHYKGKIKDNDNSIASVSIFEDFIMGIISDESGNYILGSIKNDDKSYSDNYIFYNDNDLKVKNNFKCGVDGNEEHFIKAVNEAVKRSDEINANDDISALPVKVYFEADFKMYQDNQNNLQNVYNFITGMFNSVLAIYQNESIPAVVSSAGVWTVTDPYANLNDSYVILQTFGQRTQDDFQGNLAHLLSTRNAGLGGIAWIRTLCADYNQQDQSGRYAFSNIDPAYSNLPTYSWTVNVVTHEMGHSLGSRHTHSCSWPIGGTIRAIDSCYTAEGNCFTTTRPRVGTIMSYCHLWPVNQGGGINLSLGFGQLPGDTIRLRYSQAHCLERELNSSEAPVAFDLDQNYPNPFNPATIIRFALPKESIVTLKIYDVNGRLITELIRNRFYDPGFYEESFNSSDYSLSSGIYFYKLESKEYTQTRRMILVK
ncbi:MAG: T9SS type A sorting domain-containing protein [Bacteroidetes bacterium]|nr:T9SS type A sorting domain-containing protein [Bacteroidota bacterium]